MSRGTGTELRTRVALLAALALALASGCGDEVSKPGTPSGPPASAYAGGETTVFDATSNAYTLPAANLGAADFVRHLDGDVAFERTFVSAGAPQHPGLGPVFNNTSCEACHVRNGRARGSFLLRLSVLGSGPHGEPRAIEGFGTQLQDRAIFGVQPEGEVLVSYAEQAGQLQDGTPYSLRRPTYQLTGRAGQLPQGAMLSPRVPPPVFGAGLLEAMSEATLLDLAARQASAADQISGRPNYVWDEEKRARVVGKFGWKANEPTLLQQAAHAYNSDMGVTSPYSPHETSAGQPGQDDGLGDDPEVSAETLEATEFYTQSLGVPAARDAGDAVAERGRRLFSDLGCASCHVSELVTDAHPRYENLSHQTIRPFTDLLLHDMGPGLADDRPDFEASGSEWRTPPLWGIGLLELVNGHLALLHDGRARGFEEAILWHGGEGQAARERYARLPRADREAVVRFLRAL